MRVKAYRNLHKQCWSVVAMEGENKGRVVAHPQFVQMKDVEFRVQPAGRRRVLRERRKNIHAYVIGTFVPSTASQPWEQVRYNPYKFETFVDRSGSPVHSADGVFLNVDGGLYALNPRGNK